MWDKPFRCLFKVTVGATSLDTEYVVENTGTADVFKFQAALHSYFDRRLSYKNESCFLQSHLPAEICLLVWYGRHRRTVERFPLNPFWPSAGQ